MTYAPVQGPTPGSRRVRSRRGFTLVEVMVATVLLSMIILGILEVLIGSYRVAAKARYRDHARYVIKSLADQFLTQKSFDGNGNALTLFVPTVDGTGAATPLGTGLTWTNSDGSAGTVSLDPLGLYFYVKLGDTSGAPIQATVTRMVQYIYPQIGGAETLITQNAPAGYMLQADFSITYTFQGVQMPPMTMTAVRAIP
jgi:prepilin-type N-terminal cleavage/methylation domain-containing protein